MPLLWITTFDAEVVCDQCRRRWGNVTCADTDQMFRKVLSCGWQISDTKSGNRVILCRECAGKNLVDQFKQHFEN
jgi:hypothetical protein